MHVHWNDAPGQVILGADLDELVDARLGLEKCGREHDNRHPRLGHHAKPAAQRQKVVVSKAHRSLSVSRIVRPCVALKGDKSTSARQHRVQ
jgi:hypothetical protein